MAACMALYSAAFGMDIYAGKSALVGVVSNLTIFTLFVLFVTDHPFVRVFASRPTVALGQASYSLYLIHGNSGVSVMRKCVEWGVPYLIILPLMTCTMIVAALLLFRFVEVPGEIFHTIQVAGFDRRH